MPRRGELFRVVGFDDGRTRWFGRGACARASARACGSAEYFSRERAGATFSIFPRGKEGGSRGADDGGEYLASAIMLFVSTTVSVLFIFFIGSRRLYCTKYRVPVQALEKYTRSLPKFGFLNSILGRNGSDLGREYVILPKKSSMGW